MTFTVTDNIEPKSNFVSHLVMREQERQSAAKYVDEVVTKVIDMEADIGYLLSVRVPREEIISAILGDMNLMKPADFHYSWTIIMIDAIKELIAHYECAEEEIGKSLHDLYLFIERNCIIV